ncbi:5-deoxy-glucuronate isomerase [Actinomadura opuntiae]|uniref:5-deoxy-glucuronate isomerase n=1 Tax=Actinomadura sp. OS1-43 TaxID=604315 RepID=UPI00255A8C56|nr:5-deoxy-glucuronate isomerase [Actinomadura sp. OS1-43]MDL4819569.1 5-deoxy-glucuronate isomerase [Actinomadura sp. OS1-43]
MKHHLPAGTAVEAPYGVVVTPESAGWAHTALRVLDLPDPGGHTFGTGDFEMIVLPLAGSCAVECDGERFELEGRADVFDRVSDFAYVPRDARVTVRGRGRFALAAARCQARLEPRYGPAEDVPVELRGAGPASRQVNNFGTPEGFPFAEKLIACEVLTPGGCWSSFPPHKHDEEGPDEAVLEEIYYFEVAGGGMAYQRVYGTPERPVDVLAEVRGGDVVLIPHGWHGPSMAVPGHDLYYLNVMAGPSPERAWRICDDPAHAWIRETWQGQPIDPRLPLTSAKGRS